MTARHHRLPPGRFSRQRIKLYRYRRRTAKRPPGPAGSSLEYNPVDANALADIFKELNALKGERVVREYAVGVTYRAGLGL